jgi:hypothetical protein
MLIWRSVRCVAALSATASRPTLRLYSSASFQEQLDSQQDVHLASGSVIALDERVSLKAHKLNRIFGEGDGATIIGSSHSIIQIAGTRLSFHSLQSSVIHSACRYIALLSRLQSSLIQLCL